MSTQFTGRVSGSALASAAAALFLAASPANATLILTQGPVAFSGTDTVTATRSGTPGTTSASKSSTFVTKSFSQFDSSNGVLTGAKVTVTGNRNETTVLSASGGNGGARRADASGSGTNTVLSAPGISQSFGDVGIATFKCQSNGSPSCPRTVTSGNVATSGNASSSNLSAYVGNGNVSANLSGDLGVTAQIESTATGGPNSPYTLATAQNSVTWSGSIALEYDYLAHANPSFSAVTDQDVLNIDFGTVLQGTVPSAQTFALTNLFSTLVAADTVGLDLDVITGPNSPFSLTGSTFSNLGAGFTSSLFSLMFNTANAGNFTDQILLSLSDFDAGAGMANYNLTVNLHGLVQALPPPPDIEPPPSAPVPEPASVALLGTGLLALAGMNRRKRGKTS